MIAIGSDHGGYELKDYIMEYLKDNGFEYHDFGCYSPDSVDYPDVALPVAQSVASHEYEFGILICGTGLGMSYVANKVPGIRAALCGEGYSARMAREHNDASILVLGGRVTGVGLALDIVDIFLKTKFAGGRHKLRIDKIDKIEKLYCKAED
jgi:ribose 5-phosphate isomerase B